MRPARATEKNPVKKKKKIKPLSQTIGKIKTNKQVNKKPGTGRVVRYKEVGTQCSINI